MKLRELITRLQEIERQQGGEVIVEVGLTHVDDGLCTKDLETVDAENFSDMVLLFGGDIELAPGVTVPACDDITREIRAERYRQMEIEGFQPSGDDAYTEAQLVAAACAYAMSATQDDREANLTFWPSDWDQSWFKPTDPRRDLLKAAALIVAEIERLDRQQAREEQNG